MRYPRGDASRDRSSDRRSRARPRGGGRLFARGERPVTIFGPTGSTPRRGRLGREDLDGDANGETRDEVPCDAELEGIGLCASDTDLVFCTGGLWWQLDGSALDDAAFCGYDVASLTVDCFVAE